MTDKQHRRLVALRSACARRSWAYRQRHHARGVWFRLRRTLVDAREAYAISETEAEELLGEGIEPEPVGFEIEPPKRLFFVPDARLGTLHSRRRVEVTLGADFLAARHIALLRFILLLTLSLFQACFIVFVGKLGSAQ